jgi:hypothetical protein
VDRSTKSAPRLVIFGRLAVLLICDSLWVIDGEAKRSPIA